jgi:hypothetical protein
VAAWSALQLNAKARPNTLLFKCLGDFVLQV